MKHVDVGELAIIDVLFNSVETSQVCTIQSRMYLTERKFFSVGSHMKRIHPE